MTQDNSLWIALAIIYVPILIGFIFYNQQLKRHDALNQMTLDHNRALLDTLQRINRTIDRYEILCNQVGLLSKDPK